MLHDADEFADLVLVASAAQRAETEVCQAPSAADSLADGNNGKIKIGLGARDEQRIGIEFELDDLPRAVAAVHFIAKLDERRPGRLFGVEHVIICHQKAIGNEKARAERIAIA